MTEMAKLFIGKECYIYMYGLQVTGKVMEVSDGAMLIDNGREKEIINLDCVSRIREYPRNKNGKKKSVVLD